MGIPVDRRLVGDHCHGSRGDETYAATRVDGDTRLGVAVLTSLSSLHPKTPPGRGHCGRVAITPPTQLSVVLLVISSVAVISTTRRRGGKVRTSTTVIAVTGEIGVSIGSDDAGILSTIDVTAGLTRDAISIIH